MTMPHPQEPPIRAVPRHLRSREAGVALVIVLSMLVLISVIVVAFFSTVETELSGARAYAGRMSVRTLSQMASNLVMSQIRDGTQSFVSPEDPGSERLAWVSQPGMIRTYDSSGVAARNFKLYSARNMVEGSADAQATPADRLTREVPNDWPGKPAHFTDINSPVLVEDHTGIGQITGAGGETYFADYPIVDPLALASPVEGFTMDQPPGYGGPLPLPPPATYNPMVPPSGTETGNPAPMPVSWIYVLQDGTLTAPDETASPTRTATFTLAPTAENPIVGRIAFWTDDETSKVNINTASEGTYWDTPRMVNDEDKDLANYQPTQREFQRYPGHPAMTSLAPILFATSSISTPPLTQPQRDAIYGLVPRIVGGGSEAGTVRAPMTAGALTADHDRLYASVDEMLLTPVRDLQDTESNVTRERLGRARFFLTASSRAPEVTLFNTPRVTVWPTSFYEKDGSGRKLRTPYDDLIRFCSSIGEDDLLKPLLYGFQRSDSKSATADWADIERNRELLRYLRRLSDEKLPGFGGKLVDKLGDADRNELLVEILDYIRSTNLYDDNLSPAIYSSKTAPTVQFTPGRIGGNDRQAFRGHGQVTPLRVPANLQDVVLPSTPTAVDTNALMGFGRFNTVSEAGLLFICTGDGTAGTQADPITPTLPDGNEGKKRVSNRAVDDPSGFPKRNLTLGGIPLSPTQKRIQVMLMFEWFAPSAGWTIMKPDFFVEVEQVNGTFAVDGKDLGIPAGPIAVDCYDDAFDSWGTHPWGGQAGYHGFLRGRYVPARGSMPADPKSGLEYGLVGAPITINATVGTMAFTGPEKLIVRIYAGHSSTPAASRQLVQTIEMKFPDADFPVPDLECNDTAESVPNGTVGTSYKNWWTFNYAGVGLDLTGSEAFGRLRPMGQMPHQLAGNIIRPEDTFRTLVPYHGDYRLVAASHFVPPGVFQPSEFYFNTARVPYVNSGSVCPQTLSFMTGSGTTSQEGYYWGTRRPPLADRMVPGASYTDNKFPDFPVFTDADTKQRRPATLFQTYGDFDTAMALVHDGPYINKPDEGNSGRPGELPYYYNNWESWPGGMTYFSPNRQIPGPGMLGSLPVKVKSGNLPFDSSSSNTAVGQAWRTLLFRPQAGHPGAVAPADHLWLDLFWMPVVEPYAISEPFSTAGKINLNYAVAPFSYIRRATGMVSLLRDEKVLVVPKSSASTYKNNAGTTKFRHEIDAAETLKQFDDRFAAGKAFVSASEICDIELIPKGSTYPLPSNYYSETNALTGDNARERPYTNLQGRLTTKSNTFTVHYRVQALKKRPGTPVNQWVEGSDRVVSESRGSSVIERYIDLNDRALKEVDFATDSSVSLDSFYRFRVVSSKQFGQ